VTLRAVHNYLRHALSRSPAGFYPLLAVYYLTYRCGCRCPFCSDGEGRPYWTLDDPALPAPRVLELLARIRRHTDHLVLTGGEPLEHPEVDAVLSGLPALGFDGVVLTTNALALAGHLGPIQRAVRYLVVSLSSLDEATADRWLGRPGALGHALGQIELARRTRPAGQEIIVSAVATPDNLEGLPALYRWSQARGFRFALCPQLVGVHPHPALRAAPAYRAMFELLLAEKRRGARVNGSRLYLEHMRDLTQFRCRPSTTLAVAPDGGVYYPCLELGQVAGNLLAEDLHAIRAAGLRRFGPEPACDNRCQSACALGFALILNHPASLLAEAGWVLRSKLGRGT